MTLSPARHRGHSSSRTLEVWESTCALRKSRGQTIVSAKHCTRESCLILEFFAGGGGVLDTFIFLIAVASLDASDTRDVEYLKYY